MEFDSEQAAYDFYNEYGRRMGFSIRKESLGKNKRTGEITSRVFVCCKEGCRPKDKRDYLTIKPRAETRTGRRTEMCIKMNRKTNKFYIYNFVGDHNHTLVSQDYAHMLPSQRKIAVSQATEIELAEESDIPIRSTYELMGREAGGRDSLGFIKRDLKNYLWSKRQNKMAYGEAGCVIKYFSDQVLENPSFYYSMQLDNEEQITNIFWADARMIIDHGLFGDVVSFDTTYKTKKPSRAFGVFVGLNHHRQTIVFGAALMYDETADSFIWLFQTFLKAISGKSPKIIFTDQDAAMAKAILQVMPSTYHMLCTWHMMQNALKHLNTVFKGPGAVRNVLSRFIESIEEEDQFLAAWEDMLQKYGKNDWLTSIFNLREKWAYAYTRREWFAGMKTTQLSESLNASLKQYLQTDHNVTQFFSHFERFVNDRLYKELEAEYNLCYRLARVKISVKMLNQARNVYTKFIFEKFQNQFEKSFELSIKKCFAMDYGEIFTVTRDDCSWEWHVNKDSGSNIHSCSCKMFERKGIICSHVIKVLREVMQIK